eukprot:scaffold11608_cov62-Phaeocystis_antarctica.AAC.1
MPAAIMRVWRDEATIGAQSSTARTFAYDRKSSRGPPGGEGSLASSVTSAISDLLASASAVLANMFGLQESFKRAGRGVVSRVFAAAK